MSLEDIVRDSHLTLSQIHKGRSSSLVNQLIDLQNHMISRKQAEEWVSKLRFLSINDMAEHHEPVRKRPRLTEDSQTTHTTVRTLRLRDRHEDEGVEYMAVSWRWNTGMTSNEDSGAYEYFIQRPGESRHPTDIPAICLDRAIAFAQAYKIDQIWIDMECIYQGNKEDKKVGVQAMDLVYSQSKMSLGLLLATIETQRQLDCLAALLAQTVFDKNSKAPRFNGRTDPKFIQGIREVLQIVMSDERWERSWIFQEDHCAARRMKLLVRYRRDLQTTGHFDFGSIAGELQIPLFLLRITITKFCLACKARGYAYDEYIIAPVKQYNIWNKIDRSSPETTFENKNGSPFWFQSASLGILSDLEARESQQVADRLAIYANCCKFSARLDTVSVTRAGYCLSTCILALCLLSGEILRNDENEEPSQGSSHAPDMLDLTVQKFLERFCLEFNPPGHAYHLSLVQYFRFVDVQLTQNGIGTVGWLWNLDEIVTFTAQNRNEIERKIRKYDNKSFDERMLDPIQICMLWILVRKLNSKDYREFANYLVKFIKEAERGSGAPSNRFIIKMVEAVLQGIKNQKPLRLGRLDGEVNAIFVCPSNEVQNSKPLMAFTSRSNGDGVDLEKYVSIQVQHDGTSVDDAKRLYTHSWINGIWNARGRHTDRFVFPWPFRHSTATMES